MRRLAGKLAFVHRTLWQRGQAYRWAVLLGPPPLFGCAVAALAWAIVQQVTVHSTSPTAGSSAPWAHWNRPVAQDGQPIAEAPTAALPRSDASGRYIGFQPGWAGGIEPITVDATMDVNVIGSVLGNFTLDQPTIPLARILDAGPPTGLFVGTGRAFFVVQTAGLYAFSTRLARSGTQSANCVMRLESGHHRMLRDVVLNSAGDSVMNFRPTQFQLEPGLFLVQVAVGCWRGDHVVGSGEMTLMVRHPGESDLRPAMANEVIRAVRPAPTGSDAPPPHPRTDRE